MSIGAVLTLVLWLLASPILFLKGIQALVRRWRFYREAYRSELTCHNCRSAISLVGLWRCSCGFTYCGHLLRTCPVCATLPRMVRCYTCQTTEKLPEP
jgi:hypothetical protein